jgi:hypothetical protein
MFAAKRALDKLQIRREEFTARLRTAFEGRDEAHYQKDDEADDRVPIVIANNWISMSLISLRHRKMDVVQSTNDGKNLNAFQIATVAYCRSALMRAAVSSAMAAVTCLPDMKILFQGIPSGLNIFALGYAGIFAHATMSRRTRIE